MNALARSASIAMKPATRRLATAASPTAKKGTEYSFKKAWLSDPSTYPLIVIMGCATTFMFGMGLHALTSYKDVTVDPRKRNEKMQTWGEQETPSLLSRVIFWNSWQKHAPEGLGVDHKEWLESKKREHAQQQ